MLSIHEVDLKIPVVTNYATEVMASMDLLTKIFVSLDNYIITDLHVDVDGWPRCAIHDGVENVAATLAQIYWVELYLSS